MTAKISLGISGLAGWRVLQRIETRQVEATAKDPVVKRATSYFQENLSATTSAKELVGDYKMLQVALGAFGLDTDLRNKAFIQKILESDLSDKSSFANRLSDKRYLKLAQAFQRRGDTAATGISISDSYVRRQFEKRVGEGDESYRLALNARNELQSFRTRSSSEKTLWYEILGNEPLRKVFESAFGLGGSIANLSVDRQLDQFVEASRKVLGTSSFSQIGGDKLIEKLITRYLALSQSQSTTGVNRYTAALSLLSG